jgi:hypothetical protein
MIDLAGSERAAQTQNTGRRMMEGIEMILKPNKEYCLEIFNYKELIFFSFD